MILQDTKIDRSCDNDVARLGEIAFATTMLRGLSLSRLQCRRDDNDIGNDNVTKIRDILLADNDGARSIALATMMLRGSERLRL